MGLHDDDMLARAAASKGLQSERAYQFAETLRRQLGSIPFYVFRASGNGNTGSSGRVRQVVAFASADAALAFAQQNAPTSPVRLRAVSVTGLLTVLLQEQQIGAVVFIADDAATPPPGRLPEGLRLRRDDLLRSLAPDADLQTIPTPE